MICFLPSFSVTCFCFIQLVKLQNHFKAFIWGGKGGRQVLSTLQIFVSFSRYGILVTLAL